MSGLASQYTKLLAGLSKDNRDPANCTKFVTHYLRCTMLLFAFFILLGSYFPFMFPTFSGFSLGSSLFFEHVFVVDNTRLHVDGYRYWYACVMHTPFSRLIWYVYTSDRNPFDCTQLFFTIINSWIRYFMWHELIELM